MPHLREIKERGYLPPRNFRRMLMIGSLALGKVFLTNLKDIRKLNRMSTVYHPEYIRPPKRFELPPIDSSIKIEPSHEKYLRPTLFCNSEAKEVIALANALRANTHSDWEFAEAAFEFAKRKLTLEMLPLDSVEQTLQRGTGTCIHEISVFVALCRAAGIKARYKLYSLTMIDAWSETMVADPLIKKWSDAMGYFMIHGEGEAYIDGKWVVGDVGPSPERQAASGTPISRFGEDSIGMWFSAVPGTIMHVESIPYGLNAMMRIVNHIAKPTVDKVNVSILNQINQGTKILAEKGEDVYDEEIRKSFKPKFPEPVLKKRNEIIFER